MSTLAFKYGQAPLNAYSGKISDLSDPASDIRCMLLTSSSSPDQENHENITDVEAFEVTGDGYTAGGAQLSGKTLAYDSGNDRVTFNADDVEWPDATITAHYALLYDNTPASDTDKKLLCCVDFTQDEVSSEGTFRLEWHEDGIFTIEVETPAD